MNTPGVEGVIGGQRSGPPIGRRDVNESADVDGNAVIGAVGTMVRTIADAAVPTVTVAGSWVSPATLMGPPFRHEHGTTSSLTVPVDRDAAGPARRCQPVGLARVRGASLTSVLDPARGFCRLRYDSPSMTSS